MSNDYYKSDELEARIQRVAPDPAAPYELSWDDDSVAHHFETFPNQRMARLRLIDLIVAQEREDKAFSRDYRAFIIQYSKSDAEAYAFLAREYIETMVDHGYRVHTFNSGGGVMLHETQVDGLTVWADDHMNAHPQVGFYPTEQMGEGHPGFMLEFPMLTTLDEEVARKTIDLIQLIGSLTEHDHDYRDNSRGTVAYCLVCGSPESPF